MLGCTYDGLHMVVSVKSSTAAELYKLQVASKEAIQPNLKEIQ